MSGSGREGMRAAAERDAANAAGRRWALLRMAIVMAPGYI